MKKCKKYIIVVCTIILIIGAYLYGNRSVIEIKITGDYKNVIKSNKNFEELEKVLSFYLSYRNEVDKDKYKIDMENPDLFLDIINSRDNSEIKKSRIWFVGDEAIVGNEWTSNYMELDMFMFDSITTSEFKKTIGME